MKQIDTKLKVKIGAVAVLLGLIGIIIYQNISSIPIRFFAWEFRTPLILLVIIAMLAGFLFGFLTCKFYASKKNI